MNTGYHPPALAKKLLLKFLRPDLAEEVTGDLDEQFIRTAKQKSIFRARLNYWYQVVHYMRPFAIRKSKIQINQFTMLRSYFVISWRNLQKQKMYSAIKISGLAFGIAASLLITLFIRDELSYDLHYPNGDRIYRMVGVFSDNGRFGKDVWFPPPFSSALKNDFPEIEMAGRINPVELFGAGSNEIRRTDRVENTFETGFTYADQEMLDILQLPMVYGNRKDALASPNSMVITREVSQKYFPGEDPVGKLMVLNNAEDKAVKIGGVIEDFPVNSHIQYRFLVTMTGREMWPGEQTGWRSSNYHTYVVVKPGTDRIELEKKVTTHILQKYVIPSMIEAGDVNAKDIIGKAWVEMQPVSDIHLRSEGIDDRLSHGDIRFVWLFGSIAAFIVIIACINFVNLSTARSANRAREVGLRKVVGSLRSGLISQFLTESVMFSFLSVVLGFMLAWLLLPYFNLLSAKTLVFPWMELWFFPIMTVAALTIGILAGLYPSFYLSSFKPIQVLKGNLALGGRSSGTRSLLVVFQFATSIILIIGTFVIYRQMNYLLNRKVGFEKDQVLIIHGTNTLGDEKITAFKEELLGHSQVKSATVSGYLPIMGTKRNGNGFFKEGKVRVDKAVGGQFWRVDQDYVKTMGMKIVAGRDFLDSPTADQESIIINQAMAKELGLTDPIGQKITNGENWTVVGVVEDFNYESMKENIMPLSLVVRKSTSLISVKVSTEDMASVIASISTTWKKFSPNQPIRYTFLDDSFARMYDDVLRMGRIFTTFAVLAILVACLGLFALSAFMVEQRSKEVSIRIVLGAPMRTIFRLLTQSFLTLVGISIIIAIPLAWYLMQEWLKDYAYKIEMTWDIFFLAGILAIIIALITISYQSVRAALINPMNNLRSE